MLLQFEFVVPDRVEIAEVHKFAASSSAMPGHAYLGDTPEEARRRLKQELEALGLRQLARLYQWPGYDTPQMAPELTVPEAS
jgi:hypothetical protein